MVSCTDAFCVTYPDDWSVEVGDDYLSFTHPDAPDRARATVASINMEAVVIEAGGTWPASPEDAVRAFWTLLDEAGVGELERIDSADVDGIVSTGSWEGGRMWTLLRPTSSSEAVTVEVLAPNESWESHAAVFLSGLELLPTG